MQMNLTVCIGEDFTVCIGEDLTVCIGEDLTVCIGEDLTVCTGEDLTVCIGEDLTVCIDKDLIGVHWGGVGARRCACHCCNPLHIKVFAVGGKLGVTTTVSANHAVVA